jgi:Tol biopolymer transport system component
MNGSFVIRPALILAVVSVMGNTSLFASTASQVQPVPRLTPSKSRGGDSTGGTLSTDGRIIAFTSSAANLVTNTHIGLTLDAYVRDRQTGVITLVSVSADARSGGNNHSSGPSLSGDGRVVVFESRAQNLVTNQTSGLGDIYVRDVAAGVTRLVSVTVAGNGGNGTSTGASITPNGRFVVFESAASDLVANDTNGAVDVFVRDLETGATTLVSADWQGTASAGNVRSLPNATTDPVITPNGRYVAFQSLATNLVNPGPQPRYFHIYVRDVHARTNILVSISPTGQPGTGDSMAPLISADGRYVAFQSRAIDLDTGAVGLQSAIYSRDLQIGKTLLISQAGDGADGSQPAMSADGSMIAFVQNQQIFVWDATTGAAALVSTNASGQPSQGHFASPLVSDDGKRLVFLSDAANLAAGATNGQFQVYARDLVVGATNTLVSAATNTPMGSSTDCLFPALSRDGRVLAFEAYDGNLVQNQGSRVINVFARDLNAGALEWVSAGRPASPPTDLGMAAYLPNNSFSADGRFVLFTSSADNLTTNHTNGLGAVFLWDTVLNSNFLVSVNRDGKASDSGVSRLPTMTPDGRFVAFISSSADLAPNDTNNLEDVFVRDRASGTTTLASVRPTGQEQASIYPFPPVISADGRYVAYVLGASSVIPVNRYVLVLQDQQIGATTIVTNVLIFSGTSLRPVGMDASGLWYFLSVTFTPTSAANLYRYDLSSGAKEQMSGGSGTQFTLTVPAITPDGRFVAVRTSDSGNRVMDLWRYDAVGKTSQPLVSAIADSAYSAAHSQLSISADGRFTAFVTPEGSLSPLDKNNTSDVYIADATRPGVFALVSVNQAGTAAGNGPSDSPSMSADGRFVAFRSVATDLAPNAANPVPSLFVRDLQTGTTQLISSNTFSFPPWLTANGTAVAFEGLGDIDSPYSPDVFIAHLTPELLFRLRLLPFGAGQRPSLVWTAEAGNNSGIQFKNTLSDTTWQPLPGTPVSYGTNEWLLEDSSLSRGSQRFYRAFVEP